MSEAELQSLLGAFPDAVLSIDRRSTITYANDAAIRLFGFPRESFVGSPLVETIIPPELRSQHARGMERFAATGSGPVIGRRIDIQACNAAGRRFPIELCVFLDRDQPGAVFHATIRDTSDRMAREAVVSAERERLRQFLDATADVWWDCVVGRGVRFSDSAQQVLGLTPEQADPANPSLLAGIHIDDRARVAEAWSAHIEGAVGRFECTHRLALPGGEVRWIRQRGRAVEFDAGRPVRVVGTIADVTEQQGAEERLRNAQRLEMLGLLAGGFAHDLNNYLTAIRGHAALAATEPGVTAAAQESFASIQLAITKARMLATNMLSLGKPSAEAVTRFGVRAAIDEAVELVRPGLPRSIAISVDTRASDGFEIELDPTAFQQALLNLVINARDAMPGGGRLRIDAAPSTDPVRGASMRITVEDTGVGIPASTLSRVFEPFFTTKPHGIGTGLGLAVVQQVIAGAGGSVSVESDPGRGTRFTLVLPAFASEPAAASPSSSTDALRGPDPAASLVVLLAESHPVLRPMLVAALQAAGCTVVEAEGVDRGLSAASARAQSGDLPRIDVVVSEVSGGSRTSRHVHSAFESALGRPVPLVAMSSQPESGAHDGEHGASSSPRARREVLVKPFDVAELIASVEAVTR